MSLEDGLRSALQREAAPPDFAGRILAKTTKARSRAPAWRRPITAALAAALVAGVAGSWAAHEVRAERERQQAIQARADLLQAFAITNRQLRHVSEKIQEHTRHSR